MTTTVNGNAQPKKPSQQAGGSAESKPPKASTSIFAKGQAALAPFLASADTRQCLPLLPAYSPEVVQLPHLSRTIDWVHPGLRSVVNGLVTGERPWPLFLFGPAGGGKTRAALCLCDRVQGSMYYSVDELCDYRIRARSGAEVYSGATGGIVTDQSIWQDWRRAPLTVLDEIGLRDAVSDHHAETVKRAIDNRENRPAVFISNHDHERIAKLYGDTVASRLAAGTVYHLHGPDRRLHGQTHTAGLVKEKAK